MATGLSGVSLVRAPEAEDVITDLDLYLIGADVEHDAQFGASHRALWRRGEGLALDYELLAPAKLGLDAGASAVL